MENQIVLFNNTSSREEDEIIAGPPYQDENKIPVYHVRYLIKYLMEKETDPDMKSGFQRLIERYNALDDNDHFLVLETKTDNVTKRSK